MNIQDLRLDVEVFGTEFGPMSEEVRDTSGTYIRCEELIRTIVELRGQEFTDEMIVDTLLRDLEG